jgi:hypothetical protein
MSTSFSVIKLRYRFNTAFSARLSIAPEELNLKRSAVNVDAALRV